MAVVVGCLLGMAAEVHAGPREICKTFLVDDDEGACAYADADKLKLRVAFKALVEACGRALQTNSEVRAPLFLSLSLDTVRREGVM